MISLSIPMTTGAGMGPLPSLLEEMASAAALERVFHKERLPLELIENRAMRLPLRSLSALIESASHEAGDRIFGLRVGEAMSPTNYGLWVEYGRSAKCLADGLRRVISTIHVHQTGSRMSLRQAGPHVVWEFYPQTTEPVGRQYADHVIGPMRRFVGAYLGMSWIPSWIELNYSKDTDAVALERHWHTEIRFEKPAIGIAIPLSKLSARKLHVEQGEQLLTSVDLLAHSRQQRTSNPVHAIEDIVALRLMDGKADIDGAACIAGTSIRSIQRILRGSGVSYRQLLDNARCQRARALLLETEAPITQIAMSLGYTEPGNFTRAFERWFGCSPSALRTSGIKGQGLS